MSEKGWGGLDTSRELVSFLAASTRDANDIRILAHNINHIRVPASSSAEAPATDRPW